MKQKTYLEENEENFNLPTDDLFFQCTKDMNLISLFYQKVMTLKFISKLGEMALLF
ncbi:hypothetical protein [Paenibacillus taiwanensis]|uniref:hypothetical protein n=1 Tax=Paenibacillus taiwanensis TaxID=401638 RepID=UPI00040E3CD2|nr:hypothetical protein [Paenibacillus taiwanensis]